jgi:hypothetical protein
VIFETEILWGLENKNNHSLETLKTPGYSVKEGDNHERQSWKGRGSDLSLLRSSSFGERGQ